MPLMPRAPMQTGAQEVAQMMPGQMGGQIEAMDSERQMALAKELGLHPEFVADVGRRGQMAIIDRLQESDPQGTQAKLVRLIQQLGNWLEGRLMQNQPPAPPDLQRVIGTLAQQYGIEPQQGMALVQAVLMRYREAMAGLAQTQGKARGGNNGAPPTI